MLMTDIDRQAEAMYLEYNKGATSVFEQAWFSQCAGRTLTGNAEIVCRSMREKLDRGRPAFSDLPADQQEHWRDCARRGFVFRKGDI